MEKIRVSVFASHRPQLVYTQKLYKFETENTTIEPLKLQEIWEQTNNDKQTDLVFNNEWTHQKVKFNIFGNQLYSYMINEMFYTYSNTFCIRKMRRL